MHKKTCFFHKHQSNENKPPLFDKNEGNIFSIGHTRSGTRSVCKAVQQLGISVAPGFGCPYCEKDFVYKYLSGNCHATIYKRVRYLTNISIVHWKLLLRDDPNAKFILCVRPMDEWLRVWRRRWRILRRWRSRSRRLDFQKIYHIHVFGMIAFDEDVWKRAYISHIDEVTSTINESRLLVMNVFEQPPEELWDKLASFLSCEIPKNVEFPKLGLNSPPIIPSDLVRKSRKNA